MRAMRIEFFDDPQQTPKGRDEIRFRRLGFYVYPDVRRVAVGFDITPFLERPSVEIALVNERGEVAATLTVIEVLEPKFTLTVHLRDEEPSETYEARAVLYFTDEPGDPRQIVQTESFSFPAQAGEYFAEYEG